MKEASRGPVPHHRVSRALYEQAREKAEAEGRSMSSVATAGLEDYLADLSHHDLDRLRKGAKHRPRTVAIPEAMAKKLQRLRQSRDPDFDAYLTAMYEAGWSLRALGRAVGMSGQGIQSRIRAWVEQDPQASRTLPEVTGPGFLPIAPRREQATRPEEEPVDWAVWVERDLYMVASQRAREEATPMYEVMEGVLASYLRPRR